MKKNFLILCVTLLWTINALAAINSDDLQKYCNSAVALIKQNLIPDASLQGAKQASEFGLCLGYIDGINAMANPTSYCPPKDLTEAKAIQTVADYLNDNKDKLKLPSSELVLNAFVKAYPCKANK